MIAEPAARDPSTATTGTCHHCGEPLATPPVLQARDGVVQAYCCHGCAAAAEWIAGAELEGYYRLRSAGGTRVGDELPDLAVWDRADVQAEHSRPVEGGREITLLTDGMRCAACAWLIDRALRREPGVLDCGANAVTGRIHISWDPARTALSAPLQRLAMLGYRPYLAGSVEAERERTRERRRWLLRLGVAGLGTLQAVTAHSQLPVLAHFAGYNAMSEAPGSGLASPLLLGKLLRLAGADAVSFPSPYSAYPLLGENFARIARALRLPLFEIKPSLPVPGGGIHPATAARIVRELGNDVMLTVGGGIQGHPGGAGAGVRALHAALRAAAQGQPLAEAAKESPELAAALDRWPA